MRRREFIAALGGAMVAGALPRAARAQQAGVPVIGFLRSSPRGLFENLMAAFRHGLKETGFIEDQNVTIEYRFADNQMDRLPGLAADLIHRKVAVIVGDSTAMLVAKGQTATVPIIFATGGDAVRNGLVTSFNRPGGNVTGVSFFGGALGAKRLELLRQVAPKATTIGALATPGTPTTEAELREVQAAAHAIGQQLIILSVARDGDIETAFAAMRERGVGALLVGAGTFLNSRREILAALAVRQSLPAIYSQREVVAAGGLMSYGASVTAAYRQVGLYAGRILKGEKPGDLPVMQAATFEFVINLKTAKALGLEIPPTLLALADEVIE